MTTRWGTSGNKERADAWLCIWFLGSLCVVYRVAMELLIFIQLHCMKLAWIWPWIGSGLLTYPENGMSYLGCYLYKTGFCIYHHIYLPVLYLKIQVALCCWSRNSRHQNLQEQDFYWNWKKEWLIPSWSYFKKLFIF